MSKQRRQGTSSGGINGDPKGGDPKGDDPRGGDPKGGDHTFRNDSGIGMHVEQVCHLLQGLGFRASGMCVCACVCVCVCVYVCVWVGVCVCVCVFVCV